MTHALSPLFRPFRLKQLNLRNRWVMAPMTRSHCPEHIPTEDVLHYYEKRAKGGCALILSEGTTVPHSGADGYPHVPHFYGNALPQWKRIKDTLTSRETCFMPQLWHVGSVKKADDQGASYGPSAVPHPYLPQQNPPIAMSASDIDEVIQAFVHSACAAEELGFPGVEIHGAHGYLIDQFFWPRTNVRQDQYRSGTFFAEKLISEVRRKVQDSFVICLRFSQWKLGGYDETLVSTPQELANFLEPLVDAGVDLFHCSTRCFWEAEFPGSHRNLASWTKHLTGKPVITVGSVGLDCDFVETLKKGQSSSPSYDRLQLLAEKVDQGEYDLVAVGRALIADPHWVNKVRDGEWDSILPFTPSCLATL